MNSYLPQQNFTQTKEKSLIQSNLKSGNIHRKVIYDQKLTYTIDSHSSHSATYYPQHILIDKPQDQSCRWSSGSNNQAQFITLKFDSISIAQSITFGKYHKVHVCNLKEFKVFGGLDPNNLLLLLHAGLRNDTEKETFSLKHLFGDIVVPCLYLKIVPLLAHGANFNFSIWYVEVRGTSDAALLDKTYKDYVNYKENEVIRLCLKHFRQRNMLEAFTTLHRHARESYEDPILSKLHHNIAMEGNFIASEEILIKACENSLFEEYISGYPYKPLWSRIVLQPNNPSPPMRGGHQMCIDVEGRKIYIFGGWDGQKDLSDLWEFDLEKELWKCISVDTRRNGGPTPRSCHKICFDSKMKVIFVLGRYVDPESRPNVNLEGDFWAYSVPESKWTKLSHNTAQENGPDLIYDNQMVIDSENQILYSFGGRTVGPDSSVVNYAGLYSYNVRTNKWTLLRSDTAQPTTSVHMKSRIGHSMLLDPKEKILYIFAGQRNKDYLSDFYTYDIKTDTVYEVSRDYSVQGGPVAGFTQRATIDLNLGEIYVLSGLMKEKNNPTEMVKNSFWVYNIQKSKWSKIYQNNQSGHDYWEKTNDFEPIPRFAHQMVYDDVTLRQYMFGGNPGESSHPNLRLDDFWLLTLERPKPFDILRKAQFLIRTQKFREMCQNPSEALHYLKTSVYTIVDHSNADESAEFRALPWILFGWSTHNRLGWSELNHGDGGLLGSANEGNYGSRIELFENLLKFFPKSMKEPIGSLVDLVPL
ncbi:Muskelin 1, intracellular mediator containing kelch motif [Lobulomyces angularis]|nr:Muskelin 1, intracellular mediator containing kelch motif [Lobulomyces angularis]